jgi:hypothetical protein
MNNKIRIVFFLVLFFQVALAQEKMDSVFAHLNLTFRDKPLELNKEYVSENKDTLQLTGFKFYISNLKLEYADKTTYSEPDSYYLIDIGNPNSCKIPIENIADKAISRVSFSIGVDSLASVSGALEGDLDPTRGMYWAWQSGYINMKLEGRSSSCKTRKNEFQFHIGGYMKPNYAMRKVVLEPKKSNSTVKIDVDVAQLFSQLELSKINSVMVPGTKAMQIANYSVTMFKTE